MTNDAMTNDDRLPDEVTLALLMSMAPQTPTPDDAARIKRRVLERVAAAADGPATDTGQPGFVDIAAADGWRPLHAKADMKILFDDGVTLSWLIRLHPGGTLPAHKHDHGNEECLIVSGEVFVNDVRYGAGDYQVALAGSEHRTIRAPGGCVLFLRSPSQRSTRAHAP